MTKVVGTEIERKRIQYAFWKKKSMDLLISAGSNKKEES